MKRKFVLISLILLVMLTMGVVAASENNDLSTNTKDSLSLTDDMSNKDTGLNSANNDKLLKANNNESLLKDSGSFAELDNLISTSTSTKIELDNNYTCLDSEKTTYKDGIIISKSNIIIDGKNHVIDAAGFGRIFQITGTGVTLKNIKFINAYSNEKYYNGIGIYWTGDNGNISNCIFENNTGDNIRFPTYGGAVYSTGSRLVIEKSTFKNNSAEFGGAVYITGDDSTVIKSNFIYNNAYYSGGSIYIISPNGLVDRCEFNLNTAIHGAGVWFGNEKEGETIIVRHSIFKNNDAYMGGAIFANTYDGYIFNNSFLGKNLIDIINTSSIGAVDVVRNVENTPIIGDYANYFIQNNGRIRLSGNDFDTPILNKNTILSKVRYEIEILKQYRDVVEEISINQILDLKSDDWNLFSPYEAAFAIRLYDAEGASSTVSYYNRIVSEKLVLRDPVGDYYSRNDFVTSYSLLDYGFTDYRGGSYYFSRCNYIIIKLLKPGARELSVYDPGISDLKVHHEYCYAKVLGTYTDLQYAIDHAEPMGKYSQVILNSDYIYWPSYDNSRLNPFYSVEGELYNGSTATFEDGVTVSRANLLILADFGIQYRIMDANNQSHFLNVPFDNVTVAGVEFTNSNPFYDFIRSNGSKPIKPNVGVSWVGNNGRMFACTFQGFHITMNGTLYQKAMEFYHGMSGPINLCLSWIGDNGTLERTSFMYMGNYGRNYDVPSFSQLLHYYANLVNWQGKNATLKDITIHNVDVVSGLRILTDNANLSNILIKNLYNDGGAYISIYGDNSTIDGLTCLRMEDVERESVSIGRAVEIWDLNWEKYKKYGERIPVNNTTIKNVYADTIDFKLFQIRGNNTVLSNVTAIRLHGVGIDIDNYDTKVYCKMDNIKFENCFGLESRIYNKQGPTLIRSSYYSIVECYNVSFISNNFESEWDYDDDSGYYGEYNGYAVRSYMNSNITMDNCTFYNNTGYRATCIYAESELNMSNTKFIKTSGTNDATVVVLGNLYMDNCIFDDINVTKKYGALRISGPNSYINNTVFKNCYSNGTVGVGAAITVYKDTSGHKDRKINSIAIDNCTFFNCSARYAGAIAFDSFYQSGSSYNITNSNFTANVAREGFGGAISISKFLDRNHGVPDYRVNIDNCTFKDNYANSTGSAIFSNGPLNIFNSEFINNGQNKAKYNDTSISLANSTFALENCTFNNTINSTFLKTSKTVTGINLTNIVELSPFTSAPLNYTMTTGTSKAGHYIYNSLVFSFILEGSNIRFSNNQLNNTIFLNNLYFLGVVGDVNYGSIDGVVSVLSRVNITYLDNSTRYVKPNSTFCNVDAQIVDDNGNIIVTNSLYLFYDDGIWMKKVSSSKEYRFYLKSFYNYTHCYSIYSTTNSTDWGRYEVNNFNIRDLITNITFYKDTLNKNMIFKNVTVNKGVISTNLASYTYLQQLIDNTTEGGVLILNNSITFSEDVDLSVDNPYYGIINFTNGVLINKSITIKSKQFTTVVVSGEGKARVFYIAANNVSLIGIHCKNGYTTSGGAVIYGDNVVNFTLYSGWMYQNKAVNSSGGAVFFNNSANISFPYCYQVHNNEVINGDGGVFYFNNCSNVSVTQSSFPPKMRLNGVVNGSGGVFFINNSRNIYITGGIYVNNWARNGFGGVFYIANTDNFTIEYDFYSTYDSYDARKISGNTAINGSFIYMDNASNFKFIGNETRRYSHGVVYARDNLTITANNATDSAVIYIIRSTNVTFMGNITSEGNYAGHSDLIIDKSSNVLFKKMFLTYGRIYKHDGYTFYINSTNVTLSECILYYRGYSSAKGYHYIQWEGANGFINNSAVHCTLMWYGLNGTIANSELEIAAIWSGLNGSIINSKYWISRDNLNITGSLRFHNNTFWGYGDWHYYGCIINNYGNLSLKGNKIESPVKFYGYFNNEGIITSDTYATVIENKTHMTNDTHFLFVVNLTDDMNIPIMSKSLIVYNNTTPWNLTFYASEYSSDPNNYTAAYYYYNWTTAPGTHLITVKDPNLLKLNVKTGLILCKENVLLPLTVSQTNEGELVVINATLTGLNITDGSLITFYVNGDEYNRTTINNTATLTLRNLLPGFYKVVANYGGNTSVMSVTNTTNFTVDFLNTTINITATNITFFGNYTTISYVIGNGSANLTGTVSFIIEDITYTVNVNKTSFDIILPHVGTYYITGIYSGDKYHRASRNTTKCEVVKRDTPISISNKELEIGENVTLEVVIDSHATGNVTISVNGVETVVNISSDHVARLNLTKVVAGVYYVKATYDGNDYCKANFTNTTFFVVKKVVDADLNITSSNITVTFTQNITGDVLFDINGTGYWAKIVNGTATIPMPDNLKPGVYNITAFYAGDDVWNNITLSGLYLINFKHPLLLVLGSNIFLGDDDNIHVVLTPEATGTVELYVDGGKVHTFTNATYVMNYTVSGLSAGLHNITAKYSGDDQFYPAQNLTWILVSLVGGFEFNILVKDTVIGAKNNVTIKLPRNATGNVSIPGYGSVVLVNGSATIELNASYIAGKNGIVVTYIPDETSEYDSSVRSAYYNVYKLDSSINITNIAISDNVINITVSTPNTKSEIVINNKKYDVVNGTVIVPRSDLNSGNCTVIANAFEDDYYLFATNSTIFDLPKADISASIKVENGNITVTFSENTDGEVLFDINGTLIWANITGNKAVIQIPDYLTSGNYTVNAIFKGNDKYNNFTLTDHFAVEKQNCTLLVLGTMIISGDDETIYVIISSDATGSVGLYIDNVLVKTFTDLSNILTYTTNELTVGVHNVTAIYSGDNRYIGCENITSFTVLEREDNFFNITISDTYVGQKTNVTIRVPANATGFVTVDGYWHVQLRNGTAVIEVTATKAGINQVLVVYTPDSSSEYENRSQVATYNAYKYNSTITVTNVNVDDDNIILTVETPNTEAYVTFNNVKYDVVAGKVTIPRGNLKSGNHTAILNAIEDDYYLASTNSSVFEIPEFSLTATVVIGSENITVTFDENINDEVLFDINGTHIWAEIVNGTAVIPMPSLLPGEYLVTALYKGNYKYANASGSAILNIGKVNSTIIPIVSDIFVRNNETICIAVSANATGSVELYLNGILTKTFTDLTGGFITYTLNDLAAAPYNVRVVYSGDDKYLSSSNVTSFNVFEIEDFFFAVDVADTPVGEKVNVTVMLPKNATGFISIDGYGQVEVVNGTAKLQLDPVNESGRQAVIVNYMPDAASKYNATSKLINFNIVKLNPSIIINLPNYIKSGDNVDVEITTDSDGNVTVVINGVEYEGKLVNFKPTEGNYTILAKTSETNNYLEGINFTSFKVSKPNMVVVVSMDGINPILDVYLPSDATGNVTVTIDGKDYTGVIEDGHAKLNISGVAPGDHNISASYSTVDGIRKDENATITVPEPVLIATVISVEHIDKDLNVTCVLKDINGNILANQNIDYVLNGIVGKTVTDSKGLFNVTSVDNSELYVEYAGNNLYTGYNTTIKLDKFLNVRVASEILSEPFKTYAVDYYAGERGQYFKFRVVDSDGNPIVNRPVKIGFSGVVYDLVTDAQGYAQLQINLNTPFIFTFAIGFLGDDDYNASFVVQSITVVKKTTSLTAPSKSYKASAKTKSYTVTLKAGVCSSIDGKAYLGTGKAVKLTVDGKTYHAKVNANGQATFKLKMTKKGTYKATISYDGDVRYGACKTTAIIKIK